MTPFRFTSIWAKIALYAVSMMVAIFWVNHATPPIEFVFDINYGRSSVIDPLRMFLVVCVLVPLVEEIMFRLPLLFFFEKPKWLFVALIISSTIFGYLHGGIHGVFLQGVIGLIAGYNYIKSGFFWAWLIHCSYNFYVVFLI